MKNLNKLFYIFILIISACSGTENKVPISLTWGDIGYNAQSGFYDNVFVIKNISEKPVGNNWTIYFSQLPREIMNVESDMINIELINANYFKITPNEKYKYLKPKDSIIVRYEVNNATPNISQQPEGCYWVSTYHGKESKPMNVTLNIQTLSNDQMIKHSYPEEISKFNESLKTNMVSLKQTDIIPTVKNVEEKEGFMIVPSKVSLLYNNDLSSEANILCNKLKSLYNIDVSEAAPVCIKLSLTAGNIKDGNKELYKLNIETDRILIEGDTPHGIFNGIQTLLALMKGGERPNELKCVAITDYPDLGYRGFMLDIARNFTSVSDLKKLIDVLATYKINVLHLHFADDEGWRLQIPELEELTEVGSRRGHTLDESSCLYPSYDGGYDSEAPTSGNGYYTRDEFISLLKYAAARHIRVIPEIESPGHARAAIVSMKARYKKYIGKDDLKAREYLLSEVGDSSKYISAQSYTDNIMNVSLPSTYNFMKKVISEIKGMYADAKVELPSIHIGGDEVPPGVWEGSPACKNFMKEKGMKNTHELFEYFYTQIVGYMHEQGLKFNGWQEVALHNASETDKLLSQNADAICAWNTIPEWGGDEIPYNIANNGYPIILCNVNCFYMDLAYNAHFEERGHTWAGYVDETKPFSVLPFSVYRSSRFDLDRNAIDLDSLERGKTPLMKGGANRIKGVQAQLFSETIRGYEWVEYYVFPKILGLAERGWNAHLVWENMHGKQEQEAYSKDLSHFYALISDKEIPYLAHQDVNFRLPNPGICIKNGYLYINTPIKGAQIHYTTDGVEPTMSSPVWTKPLEGNGKTIKACISYMNKKSLISTLIIKPE